jgi:sarcosine oxidase
MVPGESKARGELGEARRVVSSLVNITADALGDITSGSQGLGPAAQACSKAFLTSLLDCLKHHDVVRPRAARWTARPAENPGRRYAVEECAICMAIAPHDCRQAQLRVGGLVYKESLHGLIVRHAFGKVYPNLNAKPSMFDVIVLGLGGMGSAAVMHLAARGKHVLGLEQFTLAHDRGSSHGNTRMIRQAYYEDPAYVPLVLRAYELWTDLETDAAEQLFMRTGGLMVGRMESELVQGSLRSAREHNLKHELLEANEIERRFPATAPRQNDVALFEEPAGILFPEACIREHVRRAQSKGADLRFQTEVQSWEATPIGVAVTTAAGERFEAEQLVICAGAWLAQVTSDLNLPLRVERNVMHWFQPRVHPDVFTPAKLPVYIVDRNQKFMLYGFPSLGGSGLKAAFHHSEIYTTPQELDRNVSDSEVDAVRAALAEWMPAAAGKHVASVACMYTLTPDLHFLIGRHPHEANVWIAGGFSGHGFKFCSVVGEIITDLIIEGVSFHDIRLFDPARFMDHWT